jgi:hypothetical protein
MLFRGERKGEKQLRHKNKSFKAILLGNFLMLASDEGVERDFNGFKAAAEHKTIILCTSTTSLEVESDWEMLNKN